MESTAFLGGSPLTGFAADVFPGRRFDELAVSKVRLDGFGHQ